MKRSRLVALGLAAVMVPGLTGCWSGFNAATTTQSASGDGTTLTGPTISMDAATIVAGDPGSGKASFLATFYNPTLEPDEIVSITADGVEAKLDPAPIPILPQRSVGIQTGRVGTKLEPAATAEFTSFEARTGTYVPVVVTFTNAAEMSFNALIVPPSGFYATAAPEGTKPIPMKVNIDPHSEGAPGGEGGEEGATTTGGGAGTESGATAPEPAASPSAATP